ncbi:hypothetical protein D3C81_1522590 [compost metagenome]
MKTIMSASCSIAPDSRRSAITGRLSVRVSSERLSWDSAITGTFSSLARPFRPREISEISVARFSLLPGTLISCR